MDSDGDDVQSSENESEFESEIDSDADYDSEDDSSDPNFNTDKHTDDDEDDEEEEEAEVEAKTIAKHKGKAKISEDDDEDEAKTRAKLKGKAKISEETEAAEEAEAERQSDEEETQVRNVEGAVQQPEAKMSEEEIKAHRRSHFSGVRRKYKGGKFLPFFAEMRKPRDVSNERARTIDIKCGFKTDVEAAVAFSVLKHIFKTKRKPGKRPYRKRHGKKRPIVLKCGKVLVESQRGKGVELPDCNTDSEIKEFCKKCVQDFVQIALDVKNGVKEMPEDKGLKDALRYFNVAQPSSKPYPPDKIPPEKQSKPGVRKRKLHQRDAHTSKCD